MTQTSELANAAYLAERSSPMPGQAMYLHLSDLLLAIRKYAQSNKSERVLDYGCGGSPYQSLFPGATYKRADFESAPGIDYVIAPDGSISAESGTFDLVLSTQVLEHVENVSDYIEQSLRLLRSGGHLLISTHGVFEDHACPNDFRRWTADGLRQELEAFGLQVKEVQKLTTNGRALAFLLRTKIGWLCVSRRHVFSWPFWFIRWFLNRFRKPFDIWCDQYLAHNRVVESYRGGHTLYIALLIVAEKR